MKNILILSSSPRRGGNSDTLSNEFLRGASDAGHAVEKIFLRDKTIIDRCCGLYTQIKGKEFYFIVAAAEDEQAKMERTIDTFQGFLDCLEEATIKGVVYGLGVWHVGEVTNSPVMQQAYDMGYQIT